MQSKRSKTTAAATVPAVRSASLDARLPVGAGAQTLDADVSGQISEVAPTFGNLLSSVGNAVAVSQELLDQSVVDTVNALSKTKIEVVTEVVLRLDDDGLPIAPGPDDLKTTSVSVINYFWPTVHEWKKVALSMDLSVSAFHQEHGMSFSKTQHSSATHAYGLFWGFIGWFDTDARTNSQSSSSSSSYDQNWANGQIRIDAQLGPRRTTKFPTPTKVLVGPQIFLTPGAIKETKVGNVVTQRTAELFVKLLKSDGSNNSEKVLDVSAGSLMVASVDDETFDGNTTNSEGEAKFIVTRLTPGNSAAYTVRSTVAVKFGDIEKTLVIVL